MNKRRLFIAFVVAVLLGLGTRPVMADNKADATISVTPDPTLDIAIGDTGSYSFGNVDVGVGISTVSVSSLTLTNTGDVDIEVKKHLEDAAGWTLSGTPGLNTFSLYVATSPVQPARGSFGADHLLKDGAGNKDDLQGIEGTRVSLTAGGGETALWFRLDMPTAISATGARNFKVRFTAIAK